LLLSIYLADYFQGKIHEAVGEEKFTDRDYKKLFEYEVEGPSGGQKKGLANILARSISVVYDEELDDLDQGYHGRTIFKKRAHYSEQHLVDFYEATRFTVPFMIYRGMKWWPYIDTFANYGHLIHYSIVMAVAINLSTSVYACFNVLCLCAFYLRTTMRLNSKANHNYQLSGLQS
jgi:hypothetical protein